MGGLGNQLFQIFATIAYGYKSNNQFRFLSVETLGCGTTTIRHTYWNTLLSKMKPFLINDLPPVHLINEVGFPYNELPVREMMQANVLIYGYFQSYKYFQGQFDMICRIIGLEKTRDALTTKLNVGADYFDNIISMHFRIGDYKKIQHYHPLATYEYYDRSLQYFKTIRPTEAFTVLYFCEDVDIADVMAIVDRLTSKYPEYKFTRDEHALADWEQLLLMSCCHHNIIANSSFSWWAAYFNSHKDKVVCYPSVWFGAAANSDTRDLCPPEWVRVKV
jgi:hypothetical protein